jgi:hypothetical protein
VAPQAHHPPRPLAHAHRQPAGFVRPGARAQRRKRRRIYILKNV